MTAIKPLPMRDALLSRILEQMDVQSDIFFVTADFGSPVIDSIRERHSDRFINVGIAEQNLINVSAGLALEGYTVFAYAIAPFITMRCLEQIRVNLCLLSQVRKMNVNLVGVGAGYSYVVSGPTHQCYEDISIMRSLPAIEVLSASDHQMSARLLDRCSDPGVRYLRLDAQVLDVFGSAADYDFSGGFRSLHGERADVALIATGYMCHTAVKLAARLADLGVSASVEDLFNLSRFDREALVDRVKSARLVVSMEEGFVGRGGLDSIVQALLRDYRIPIRYIPIGVAPDYSFELGTRLELHDNVGIGESACLEAILSALAD
jgi:transketolase